jgi:hypothetical protein
VLIPEALNVYRRICCAFCFAAVALRHVRHPSGHNMLAVPAGLRAAGRPPQERYTHAYQDDATWHCYTDCQSHGNAACSARAGGAVFWEAGVSQSFCTLLSPHWLILIDAYTAQGKKQQQRGLTAQETLPVQEQLQQEHSDRNSQTMAAGRVATWCAAVHWCLWCTSLSCIGG